MQVSESTDKSQLFVKPGNRMYFGDWGMSAGLLLIGWYPYFFVEDAADIWYESIIKFLFGFIFTWLALVNMGDTERAVFDKKKDTCRITRKNWWETRDFVQDLNKWNEAIVEEVKNEKKKLSTFRVTLDFSGIMIPLTNTMFSDKTGQEKVAERINEWMKGHVKRKAPLDPDWDESDSESDEPDYQVKEKWSN